MTFADLRKKLANYEKQYGLSVNKALDRFKGLTFPQFWHALGLPTKNGVGYGLFDYEQQLVQELQDYKFLWIKKATGLGITELMLRYIGWLCLKDNAFRGCRICIVTGPRIDLSIMLVNRIKRLFPDLTFDNKETVIDLNGCRIEAYPSHHLDAMRGLDKVKFILLDEADFFPPGQQQDSRDVSERYIAKSNPWIVMVSTPNAPGGLFESIEREDKCLYRRIFLPYHVGLGKIYSQDEIAQARRSPGFEREYNLAYIGTQGNVFSFESIQAAAALGKRVEYVPTARHIMGVDPAWSDSGSKFGMVICQSNDAQLQVLYADELQGSTYDSALTKVLELYYRFGVNKIYVDAANPVVVKSLKAALGERLDYQEQLDTYRRKWRYNEQYLHQSIQNVMNVIPVSFGAGGGKEMLQHARIFMDNRLCAIDPDKFPKLLVALRTAVATDNALDKQTTAHNDILDAFLLSLRFFNIRRRSSSSSVLNPNQNYRWDSTVNKLVLDETRDEQGVAIMTKPLRRDELMLDALLRDRRRQVATQFNATSRLDI